MKHLIYALFILISGALHAAEPAIMQLHADRDLSTVHPQHDRVGLRLQINRPDGSPISGARLHVLLQAPETPWLASTDFPIVEGSQLMDAQVEIDGSEFTFAIVPPIRGVYKLQVAIEPLPGDSSFSSSQQTFETSISENPKKQRNLAVLLTILVVVGGISGFVLGRSESRAPVAIALLLLLAAGFRMPDAAAHGDEHSNSHQEALQPLATEADATGHHIDLQMLTREPRVGELASLRARFRRSDGTAEPARFRLSFTQLEHNIEVFSTEVSAPDGILNWRGQFYDGSNHRVDVEAVPLDRDLKSVAPARATQEIAVEAIAPPARAVAKSLGFLLGVTALAMVLGFALGRIGRLA